MKSKRNYRGRKGSPSRLTLNSHCLFCQSSSIIKNSDDTSSWFQTFISTAYDFMSQKSTPPAKSYFGRAVFCVKCLPLITDVEFLQNSITGMKNRLQSIKHKAINLLNGNINKLENTEDEYSLAVKAILEDFHFPNTITTHDVDVYKEDIKENWIETEDTADVSLLCEIGYESDSKNSTDFKQEETDSILPTLTESPQKKKLSEKKSLTFSKTKELRSERYERLMAKKRKWENNGSISNAVIKIDEPQPAIRKRLRKKPSKCNVVVTNLETSESKKMKVTEAARKTINIKSEEAPRKTINTKSEEYQVVVTIHNNEVVSDVNTDGAEIMTPSKLRDQLEANSAESTSQAADAQKLEEIRVIVYLDSNQQQHSSGRKKPQPKIAVTFHCPMEECDFTCNSESELQEHQSSLGHIPPPQIFVCGTCGGYFDSKALLKQHDLIEHRLVSLLHCRICDKAYRKTDELREHEKLHNQNILNNNACVFCDEVFHSQNMLMNHVKSIHEDLCITCDICGRKKFTEDAMQKHKDYHLKKMSGETVKGFKHCPYEGCEKKYKNNIALQHHTLRIHEKVPPTEICYVCGKGFLSELRLREHLKFHDPNKPYPCNKCPKGFQQKRLLEKHLRSHERKAERELKKLNKPRRKRSGLKKKPKRIKIQIEDEEYEYEQVEIDGEVGYDKNEEGMSSVNQELVSELTNLNYIR